MKRIGTSMMFVLLCLLTQAQTVYTLEDCRKLSTTHNKEILIAGENVKATKYLQKAAKTQYLPNLSANGAYFWNQKNLSLLSSDAYLPVYALSTTGLAPTYSYAYMPKSAFEYDIHNIYAGAVTLTQPIFMGGKILQLNKIAKYNNKIAEAKLNGQTSDVILETDEDYWRVVSLVNKEKLAKSYVALLQKMDSDLEKSIAFGVATKSDGLSVKVKLNEAEMTLLQVQNGLSLSKMALAQICGLPLESDFSLADENMQPNEIVIQPVVDKVGAIEKRYEIESLKQGVNIAEANRKIMLSRFMPNAGLTAGYLVTNPNSFNGYENKFGGMWQVGVAVNIPIFHFGEKIYTLKAANREKKIAQYKLDEAREKIDLDISQASYKITEAIKKVKIASSNKAKAEENLKYANIGFESGVISPSVLMEAQTAWLKANTDQIDAAIDAKLCEIHLQKAIGELK